MAENPHKADEAILQVNHLSKAFGKNLVLKDIDFTVCPGDVISIIGASGSGKSTLLHMLGGVDRPTSGTVLVDGKDIFRQTDEQLSIFRRREIGLVYQFFNLIPVLTVVENITMPVLLDHRKVNQERLDELLELLGLSEKRDAFPNQLSGGQQQRVAIGRALINAPTILLADEPTGNLDSKNSQEVVELLRYSNQKYNQTTVLITHDENVALQAKRIITIRDGRIEHDEVIRK